MPEPAIILHHYAASPFSEKARLALGLKGLAWGSVEIPALPPRPRLDPLTGGYRRVPVLQIGADIHCDTHAILPALERLAPEPTLHPGPDAALARALAFHVERAVWIAAIGVRVHFAEDPPEDFLRDRREDYLYVDMSRAAMAPHFLAHTQALRAEVAWLAAALADGRAFLAGAQAGALDLACYHTLSLPRSADPEAVDRLLGLEPLLPWYGRVAAIGHGRPSPMSPEAALAAARAAEPAPLAQTSDVPGLPPGAAVTVTPDDFAKVAVAGTLVAAGPETVVIRRADPRVGALHLHFPRAGFIVAGA